MTVDSCDAKRSCGWSSHCFAGARILVSTRQSSTREEGSTHALASRNHLALATIFHDRAANRGGYLPHPANYAHRLDSRINLVGLRPEPIQDRQENFESPC